MPHAIIHRIAGTGNPLGVGVTGVQKGTLVAYLKPFRGDSYIAANEMICGELGRFLGLPIPVGGIAHAGVRGQPPFFASVGFDFSDQLLPPIDPTELAKKHPDLLAGILAFDAFAANLDRHARNLSIEPRQGTVHVFDHSHALLGHEYGKGVDRLKSMRDRLCLNLDKATDPRYTRHCLGDYLVDASRLLPWFLAISEMPIGWLQRVVEKNGLGLNETEAREVLDFLIYRRDNLRNIFQKEQHQFLALKQGSLL